MYLEYNLFQCYVDHDLCMEQPVIEFKPAGLTIGQKYYTLIYKNVLEISCRETQKSHIQIWDFSYGNKNTAHYVTNIIPPPKFKSELCVTYYKMACLNSTYILLISVHCCMNF
jgi:hypothetical protein